MVDGNASENYWGSIIKTSRNLAIRNGRVAGQEYLVITGSSVILQTLTLFIARQYFKRYSGSYPSRMVTEVQNGIVKKDPHRIGGQEQGKGNAAGFNIYWNDWNDIRRMTIIAQNCVPGPGVVFLVVDDSSVYLETPSIIIAKNILEDFWKH